MEIRGYEETQQPKNKNHKALKILLIAFCVLIVATGVSVYILYGILTDDGSGSLFLDPREENIAQAASNEQEGIVLPNEPEENSNCIEYNGKKYEKNENIVNLLFLGIDTDTERKVKMMGYRSDMLMVCAVDTKTNKATLISIPRDTYTTMYWIDENNGEIEKTGRDKINAAYSYGGGATKYSYQNAMACVEMFLERRCELEDSLDFTLDVPVYLYAGIDMDGIPKVASSVGGVEVTLERGISGVGSKGQTVLLKYSNAELYVRTRHGAGGDLDRARRQQKFMLALAKTIKDMGAADIILNLYDDLQKYVWTNLSTNQMVDFAKILMKTDIDSIENITVPTTGKTIHGSNVQIHDEEATLQLLLDVYYNEVS